LGTIDQGDAVIDAEPAVELLAGGGADVGAGIGMNFVVETITSVGEEQMVDESSSSLIGARMKYCKTRVEVDEYIEAVVAVVVSGSNC
jgi:hypothetical protein